MVAPVINRFGTKHSGVSGMRTQLFCQHSGETPLRGGYAQSLTEASNANRAWEASWPSFVDPIARVRQIQWPNTAWTQGWANPFSVGLECAGYAHFTKAQWLTPEGLKQLENLAHEWVYYWKLEAKYGNEISLRWLSDSEVKKVMGGDRKIDGFCTHKQIDPGSRTDPGPNFPYDRLMTRIKQLLGKAPKPATKTDLAQIMGDDMPFNIFNLSTKKQKLTPGKWKTLDINDKGHVSHLGGNEAQRSINFASVTFPDLPVGVEVHLRWIVADFQKGKPTKIHKTFEYEDFMGSHGYTKVKLIQPANLANSSRYRLRLQALIGKSVEKDVHVSRVHIDSYCWKA